MIARCQACRRSRVRRSCCVSGRLVGAGAVSRLARECGGWVDVAGLFSRRSRRVQQPVSSGAGHASTATTAPPPKWGPPAPTLTANPAVSATSHPHTTEIPEVAPTQPNQRASTQPICVEGCFTPLTHPGRLADSDMMAPPPNESRRVDEAVPPRHLHRLGRSRRVQVFTINFLTNTPSHSLIAQLSALTTG